MRRARGALLLLLPLLLVPGAAAAATQGPVAVVPFKNLNRDTSYDWLSAGVAETMIADIKKSGKWKVVERGQLESAIAEVDLQGLAASDPATAVKIGKLVGAKSIVVGSFQLAGPQLRFVARSVEVETGIIKDTAKVTGPKTRVFGLQDQIVRRLLGLKTVRKARAKPGAAGAKAPSPEQKAQRRLKAYRLYAMSLTAASDADKVPWLREAIDVDPEFEYAVDDLEQLMARLAGYRAKLRLRDAEKLRATRKAFYAQTDPLQKSMGATLLLAKLMGEGEYRLLLEDAETIRGMTWEKPAQLPTWKPPLEIADYYSLVAHRMLVHLDLVLQLGEKFLEDYPDSAQAEQVVNLLESVVEQKQRIADGAKALPADLEKVEERRQKAAERAKKRGETLGAAEQAGFDMSRCSMASRHQQWEEVIQECGTLVDRFSGETDEQVARTVLQSRSAILWANYQLGHFDTARKIASWLIVHEPEFAREQDLEEKSRDWPR